jgi:biopolymer transport protein TolR
MTQSTRRRILSTRAKSEINITPLIDVLLVLIVIFMVIAPMTPKGLPASVPQLGQPDKAKEDQTLVLSLDGDGAIRLNQEPLEFAAILSRLRDVFSTRADRTIFVQADDEVLFNEVAQVIDTAKSAGADRVGLMTASR